MTSRLGVVLIETLDNSVTIDEYDLINGGLPRERSIVPWGIVSPAQSDIRAYFGRLDEPILTETVERLVSYLRSR